MIEWLSNDNGLAIPHVQGKPLCSRANPEREADLWVEKVLSKLYSSTDSIVVLGYGAGFHVFALQKHINLKIYVFEMLEGISQSIASNDNISIIGINRIENLWNHNKTKEIVGKKFQIFQHYPSTTPFLKEYDMIRHNLTARFKPAFRKHAQENLLSPLFANISVDDAPGLLTATDIAENTMIHQTNSQKAYLWKILGELLK